MCVSMFGYVHVSTNAWGSQRSPSGPLQLELQVFMCHLMWALGSKLGSSVRAKYDLSC